ncbi:ABC transporter ATP-binding protein [Ancylobacter radicis]|uniref:ABC transporter ATP-binding protein n=1 Tax=Ancylobacter radicis TaxID=2836179 RepID=A0ABS5R5X5_9HYPH|nr:ABC transporter ATP-binding protein [Ancylobacter radicis]
MTLELEKVSRAVAGVTHIHDVSLRLERGSLNVLLGATLAGKTSLMRLMAGLDAPTSGRVLVDGKDVTGFTVKKRSVAMVYQQFINYPALTVYENIASPLRVAGLPRSEIEARVAEAARLLKLTPYLQRRPLEMSGGQQQRCAIARALVKRADLVLLDEPLANLDYKLREELREELPRIFASTGAVFVYATTEPMEALLLGGSTATLREGRLTQFGPTAEVYRRPGDLATARVFSDPPLNTLQATKSGGTVRLQAGGSIPVAGAFASVPDGSYTIGVRAHHLQVEAGEGHEAAPSINGVFRLRASVTVAEITGSETYLHMEAGETPLIALLPGIRGLEPGTAVDVLVDPGQILLFDSAGARAGRALDAAA